MMILGGAIIPPLQGKLADIFSIQSYWIAVLLCVFTFYSYKTKTTLIKQGLNTD